LKTFTEISSYFFVFSIVLFYVFNCVVLCVQLCCSMYSIVLFYVFDFVVLCIQLCCSMYSIVLFYSYVFSCVVLYIVFVDCAFLCILSCKCVPYYCHRVSTHLQLNISSYHIISYHIISYIMSYLQARRMSAVLKHLRKDYVHTNDLNSVLASSNC
jgi:hypothetical protein